MGEARSDEFEVRTVLVFLVWSSAASDAVTGVPVMILEAPERLLPISAALPLKKAATQVKGSSCRSYSSSPVPGSLESIDRHCRCHWAKAHAHKRRLSRILCASSSNPMMITHPWKASCIWTRARRLGTVRQASVTAESISKVNGIKGC
jgi:hypothetical protein